MSKATSAKKPACTQCGSSYNLRRDSTAKSGYKSICRTCDAENCKERRIRNRQSNHGRSLGSDDPVAPGVDIEDRGNELTISATNARIRTLKDLLVATDTDLGALDRDGTSEWVIDYHRLNKYEQMAVINDEITYADLWQVKANLKRRTPLSILWPAFRSAEVKLPPLRAVPRASNTNLKRALIVPDQQYGYSRDLRTGKLNPFHDRLAIDITLQMARVLKPDRVIFLGDALDLPEFSDKFVRSPDFYFTTQPAVYELAYDFGRMRQVVGPDVPMDWILGNHEDRLPRAVFTNLIASSMLKPADEPVESPNLISMERLIGTEALGITVHGPYPNGEVWLNPNLVCMHGDICRSGEGATARALLSHARASVIYGHLHRIELLHTTHHGPRGAHRYLACCPGTVARIDGAVPAATKRLNWQQGLAVVEYEVGDPESGSGLFHVEVVPIHEGKAIWRGNIFQGTFDLDALVKATKWETY